MEKYEILVQELEELLKEHPLAYAALQSLLEDTEIKALIEQVNAVTVQRLFYNDHGIIHSLIVTRNAVKIAKILKKKGILFNIEKEKVGDFEDVLVCLVIGSFLHDLGNSIHRYNHELLGVILAKDFVLRILEKLYKDNREKMIRLCAYILDTIYSHEGTFPIIALESKVVALADSLDMEEGRARIPYKLGQPDIHKYSALAIKKVEILEGEDKPLLIRVEMTESSGVFQIEELVMRRIKAGNMNNLLKIVAYVKSTNDIVIYPKENQ